MMKKGFLIVIKLFVATFLIGWLLSTGKLDFSLTHRLFDYPLITLSVLGLCLLNMILPALRLGLILKARSQKIFSVKNLTLVNWIGMFFSSVLPGSVSGDLLKIYYIKKWDPAFSSSFLLFAGFVDRLMGLTGLILLLGFFSIFNYHHLLNISPDLKSLLHINFILCFGVIFSLIVFFFFHKFITSILKGRVLQLWVDLISVKKSIARAIFYSLLIQMISVFSFYLLTFKLFQSNLELIHLMSFIPLGFISLALPLAPGGLGVGHAVFQKLFEMVGENNGANFFNLYFLVQVSFNLLGFFPYLLSKKELGKEAN